MITPEKAKAFIEDINKVMLQHGLSIGVDQGKLVVEDNTVLYGMLNFKNTSATENPYKLFSCLYNEKDLPNYTIPESGK